METKPGGVRYVAALASAVLSSLVLGAAGLFLAGVIGDAVMPDFGYEFQGLEWLGVGAVIGASVGSLLGAWSVLRGMHDRGGAKAVIYVAAAALGLDLVLVWALGGLPLLLGVLG